MAKLNWQIDLTVYFSSEKEKVDYIGKADYTNTGDGRKQMACIPVPGGSLSFKHFSKPVPCK